MSGVVFAVAKAVLVTATQVPKPNNVFLLRKEI